jgi:glyoxylase-like metal-dependent hydrolase (beta-lactamase superfamily II)
MEMPEDDFTDILRKAMIGNALPPAELARRAETSLAALNRFQKGQFDKTLARKIATALDLDPDAYASIDSYRPDASIPPEIQRLELPFGRGHVNAWMLKAENHLILFDTGYQAKDLLAEIDQRFGRLPDRVLITHAHRDHTGGIRNLLQHGIPIHAQGNRETTPMKPGDSIRIGKVTIRACDLAGHAIPALGYRIDGLPSPVLITGDALFAGSIGGCATPEAYRIALKNIHHAFEHSPPNCVILPGHGPATTWGAETKHNPFIAGLGHSHMLLHSEDVA